MVCFERVIRVVCGIGVSVEVGRGGEVVVLREEEGGRRETAWRIVGVVVRRTIFVVGSV